MRMIVDSYDIVASMGTLLALLEIVRNDWSGVAFPSDFNYGEVMKVVK